MNLRLSLLTTLLSIALGMCTAPAGMAQFKPAADLVPSTNSMNLGLFTDMPVSLNSGLPQINVPVYTIKGKDFTLPISLNYHAGGVKPEIHPSWVGMGWSLNTGGSINRVVNGLPDEYDIPILNWPHYGYFFDHGRNSRSDWSSTTYLQRYVLNDLGYDYAPDVFYFSFPGHSGKFFLDDGGNWRVECDQPVQVKFAANDFATPYVDWYLESYNNDIGRLLPFNKFTLVDEHGVQYVFGEEPAIEYSTDILSGTEKTFFASSWQLRRIISADGVDVVEFNYERGPYQSFLYNSISNNRITGFPNGVMDPGCSSFFYGLTHGGKIMSPVYLTSITYARQNLRLDFLTSVSNELSYKQLDYVNVARDATGSSSTEVFSPVLDDNSDIPYYAAHGLPIERSQRFIWYKLDRINVVNTRNSANVRSAKMTYNNLSTERLRLSSVDFADNGDNNIQNYTFGYNTSSLPDYLMSRGDHWGFNNGGPPYAIPESINFYSSKEPQPFNCQNGILQQITYPTGGMTKFEYSLHGYSGVVNSDHATVDAISGTAGGLRVTKITEVSNAGAEIVKNYYYVHNYQAGADPGTLPSSGILDALPKYQFDITNAVDLTGSSFNYSLFCSNPIIPLSHTSSGQHVGYSEVVEKRSDGAYTIYKFTNHDNGYGDDDAVNSWNRANVPYIPRSIRDFERGRPLEKTVYDKNGNPIRSEVYEYDRLNAGINPARCIEESVMNICPNVGGRGFVSRSAYYQYDYPFVMKRLTTKTYESGSSSRYLATVQDFTYQNRLAKTSITTDSKNGQLKTEKFYPWERSEAVYTSMVQKNMLDFPVQENSSRGGQLINTSWNEYNTWGNGGIYLADEKQQTAGGPVQLMRQVDQYDVSGNIIQQTPRNGLRESYIWGYNRKFPIAQVTNASAGEIFHTSFEEGTGWDSYMTAYDNTRSHSGSYSGRIDKPSSGEQVSMGANWLNVTLSGPTKYKYSGWAYSNGPSVDLFLFMKRAGETGYFSYVDATSTTVTGSWVYLEKEFTVPADVTQLNIRVDNNGGGSVWFDDIRLCPSAAQMTTYTYEPLIGMTSSSDVNNKVTYYEYDGFQRLLRIRDDHSNILKQFEYKYRYLPHDPTPNWQATGNVRCQTGSGYNTGHQEQEQKDNNVYSSSWNTTRWVDIGVNTGACPVTPDWQVTGNYRCQKNGSGQNTGHQEQEQRDNNPYSGQGTRWVDIGANTSACPVVYARVDYDNGYYDGNGFYHANIILRFFSNPAGTNAMSVVNLPYSVHVHHDWGPQDYNFNGTANGTSVVIQNDAVLNEFDMNCDPNNDVCSPYNIYYTLNFSSAYITIY